MADDKTCLKGTDMVTMATLAMCVDTAIARERERCFRIALDENNHHIANRIESGEAVEPALKKEP